MKKKAPVITLITLIIFVSIGIIILSTRTQYRVATYVYEDEQFSQVEKTNSFWIDKEVVSERLSKPRAVLYCKDISGTFTVQEFDFSKRKYSQVVVNESN